MTNKHAASQMGITLETRPTSGMAIASLVLGVLCLCLGPLGLVPLILGIVGVTQTGETGSRKGRGLAIAGLVLGGLGMLGTLIWVMFLTAMGPALVAAKEEANFLKSQSQVRSILQGVVIYSGNNNEQYPPVDGWEQALLENGLVDSEGLIAPMEDGDGISYYYLGGENTFDYTQIVVYEDPNHWPERGVIVGFADAHVELVDFDVFERMLAEQLADSEP